MGNKGKYWLIAILGFLIIILAGVAVAGNRRSRNSVSSTDNPDRQEESRPQVGEGSGCHEMLSARRGVPANTAGIISQAFAEAMIHDDRKLA